MNDMLELKYKLDEYAAKYETKSFIKSDPVQFVHRFSNKEDIAIAGFIASMFSYGKREIFIEKLNHIFNLMNNKPLDFIKAGNFNGIKDSNYRFSQNIDFVQILKILNRLYSENETIESLFKYCYLQHSNVWQMFQGVVDYFYARADMPVTNGFYHLLPNPAKKSALKRMNMMLRWFVRKSAVDTGIWDFIDKSELLLPLDTHSARISRDLGLLKRKDNGYESVTAVTAALKQFDAYDPVKYDFALFGYGVNNKQQT